MTWPGAEGSELLACHADAAVAIVRVDQGALLVVRGFAHAPLGRAEIEAKRLAEPSAVAV